MMRVIAAAMLMGGAMTATPAHAQDAVEVSAMCMDARGAPHPAAQTFSEREPPNEFEGELFRCLAGTYLRYDVDHAVRDCAPGEALWFGVGTLSCRAAAEHPREYDRELLRQFGPGVKLLRLAAAAAPAPRARPERPRYPRYN
jgi:hypothetical protein